MSLWAWYTMYACQQMAVQCLVLGLMLASTMCACSSEAWDLTGRFVHNRFGHVQPLHDGDGAGCRRNAETVRLIKNRLAQTHDRFT
jgi:hypothetical protein